MTWPRYSLRTMLLAMAVAVPVVWFVGQFVRQDAQYVDPLTGAVKQTTSYWGLQTSEQIDSTALGDWLEERGQGQPLQWQFIGSHCRGCFACGEVPPVYYLRSDMPRVIKLLSQAELLAFVQILRTGTRDEQMAAVEVIEKRLRTAP